MWKAYLRIVFALFAIAFVAVGVAVLYWYWDHHVEPSRRARSEIARIEKTEAERIDHGAKIYESAMVMLRQGRIDNARQSLAKIMGTYSDSDRYGDARRIIGEQNLDMLLTADPMPGKSRYVVERGDTLIGITARTDTTMEYLARINDLQDTRLSIGDEFVVCALDEFSVVVNLSTTMAELRQNDLFFAEYPLAGYHFPPGTPSSFDARVTGKSARADGVAVRFDSPLHARADKQIGTSRAGVVFRTAPVPTGGPEDAFQFGIYLDRSAVEELYVILRDGAKVHVRK